MTNPITSSSAKNPFASDLDLTPEPVTPILPPTLSRSHSNSSAFASPHGKRKEPAGSPAAGRLESPAKKIHSPAQESFSSPSLTSRNVQTCSPSTSSSGLTPEIRRAKLGSALGQENPQSCHIAPKKLTFGLSPDADSTESGPESPAFSIPSFLNRGLKPPILSPEYRPSASSSSSRQPPSLDLEFQRLADQTGGWGAGSHGPAAAPAAAPFQSGINKTGLAVRKAKIFTLPPSKQTTNMEMDRSIELLKRNLLLCQNDQELEELISLQTALEKIRKKPNAEFDSILEFIFSNFTSARLEEHVGALSREKNLKSHYQTATDLIQTLLKKEKSYCLAILVDHQKQKDPGFIPTKGCASKVADLRSHNLTFLSEQNLENIISYYLRSNNHEIVLDLLASAINDPDKEEAVRESILRIRHYLAWECMMPVTHVDNQPFLKSVITLLDQDDRFENEKEKLLSILVINPDHLSSLEVHQTCIKGFHHRDTESEEPQEIETPSAVGMILPRGPQLKQPNGISMAVTTFDGFHEESGSAVRAHKFSTFWPPGVSVYEAVRGAIQIIDEHRPIESADGSDLYFGSFRTSSGDTFDAYIYVNIDAGDLQNRMISTIFPALSERRSSMGPQERLTFHHSVQGDLGSPVKGNQKHKTPIRKMKDAIKASGISPLKPNSSKLDAKIQRFFDKHEKEFKLVGGDDADFWIQVPFRVSQGMTLKEYMESALVGHDHMYRDSLKPAEIEDVFDGTVVENPPVIIKWEKTDFYEFFRNALKGK